MTVSIIEYLRRGPSSSKEIQVALGQSQSTVSRLIKSLRDRIVQIGSGRSRRYAAVCNAFNSGNKIPLYAVDKDGKASLSALIRPLIHGGFFVAPEVPASYQLLGDQRNGLFGDLPYFLRDLRPQGFLGRLIARRIAEQSHDFPENPNDWTSNHIGRYLISNGDDLPGNFIFGEQSLLRIRRRPAAVSYREYPEIAKAVMAGENPGSSAGGEQPKFTIFNNEISAHVIVKFSSDDKNKVSERWRDILITEYHAAQTLNNFSLPVAVPRLLKVDDRLFLETPRFDRIGMFGRSSMISLQMVAAEYADSISSWPWVMQELLERQLVDPEDVVTAQTYWLFGRLINNTDMHLGNLSLAMKDGIFSLLPLYDMCSMGFAPKASGEVLPFVFKIPDLEGTGISQELIRLARDMAHEFWNNLAEDNRISDSFREYLIPLIH